MNADSKAALSTDTGDFWVDPSVPYMNNPTSVEFLRNAVSRYHPVILRGVSTNWPAMKKWNRSYFESNALLHGKKINVNLTAEGHGDYVASFAELDSDINDNTETLNGKYFVYPAEQEMAVTDFFRLLDISKNNSSLPVPYLSQQNDNLRTCFPEVIDDVPPTISLAVDAFGTEQPEAVNLWIGDERSVSSIHKDHFENFYAVISGEKTFTLLPPTDIAYLPESEYPTAQYVVQHDSGVENYHNCSDCSPKNTIENLRIGLSTKDCPNDRLSWIPLDPDDPDVYIKHPKFKYTHPIRCTVRAGEILYLPAMWYHRVSQNQLTIAVNYWFDQRFDFRYVFHQHVRRLQAADYSDNGEENDDFDNKLIAK